MLNWNVRTGLCLVGAHCVPAIAAAQPVIAERFDSGVAGWTLYSDGTALTWSSGEGQPPGCLRASDMGLGGYWGFNAAAGFLGDRSCFYAGTLAWQHRTDFLDTDGDFEPDARIEGAGLTLVLDLPNPTPGVWMERAAILSETGGWRLGSLDGAVPTPAEFRSVLASVTAIKFRAEFYGGPTLDTGWIDNVVMTGCRADFNADCVASSQDFFDFLTAFFSSAASADVNHDGAVNSQDFFDFLTVFFEGC